MKPAILAVIVVTVFSCSRNDGFSVSGFVKDGAGKTVYFENITASYAVLLDSAVLTRKGAFKFSGKRPQAPDFYQLRSGREVINVAIDSTENIVIRTDTAGFARNYTVEGSEESAKIKDLAMLQFFAEGEYKKLESAYKTKTMPADSFQVKAGRIVNAYKDKAKEYIFADLSSASAYFALFQQINGMLIFDPYEKSDSKVFGAVANVWNVAYPNAKRTEHLKSLFMSSLRIIRNGGAPEANTVDSRKYLDISLKSVEENEIRLSEACKGKVVLLDFTAYELQESPERNKLLARLYGKYASKSFEVYQVSFDSDLHFWKNAAFNLPWICVRDPDLIYSEILKRYNINALPVSFILDKKGYAVARIDDLSEVEKVIAKIM
jgi:hypothetical protein